AGEFLREAVSRATGSPRHAVLVNSSHTHAAPPPEGMPKLGGTTRQLREEESRFADSVIDLVGSAASLAVERLEPVVVGAARTDVALGVNRRQRDPEAGTLVGWNPDAICDRDVATLRIDRVDGDAIATVIAYGCHPC